MFLKNEYNIVLFANINALVDMKTLTFVNGS